MTRPALPIWGYFQVLKLLPLVSWVSFLSSFLLLLPHLLCGWHSNLTFTLLKWILYHDLNFEIETLCHLKDQFCTPPLPEWQPRTYHGQALTLLMFPSSELISCFPRLLLIPLSHATCPAVSYPMALLYLYLGCCLSFHLHARPSLDWLTLHVAPWSSPPSPHLFLDQCLFSLALNWNKTT